MADDPNCFEVCVPGRDEVTSCRYVVTASCPEAHYAVYAAAAEVHEVVIHVEYQFTVLPTPDLNHPIAEINPCGALWCFQHFPGGLSGLREEIFLLLDRARIPLAARNDTVHLIFENFLTENRLNSTTARYVFVGLILQTKTRFDCYEESTSMADQDDDEQTSMADRLESNEVPEQWDEAADCLYSVRVSRSEDRSVVDVHEVSLNIEYEFSVTADREDSGPIVEPTPPGGRWCLQDFPDGLSGLRKEITLVLDQARIPSAARDDTLELIFENFLTENRMSSNVRYVVGVTLQTETKFDFEPEEPMYYEDEDEEYDRVLEASMEEDYSRETPARREAVDALEKVRVSGGERETSCVVCLEEFCLGTEVTKMPCSHVFHQDCLVRWLESRYFCPLCKFELPYVEDDDEIYLVN